MDIDAFKSVDWEEEGMAIEASDLEGILALRYTEVG